MIDFEKHTKGSIQPKRILLIAPQPFYEDRGTPIAVSYTLKALSDSGFIIDLATFPMGIELRYPAVNIWRGWNPFRFKRVPIGLSYRKLILDVFLFFKVLRLAWRQNYSCIHGVEEGAAMGLVVKALFCTPVIYDMQSSIPEQLKGLRGFGKGPGRWISLKFEQFLVRNADYIIASRGLADRVLSIDTQKKVAEFFFEGSCNVSVNPELIRDLGINSRPTIVYTGNFAYYQGLYHLLKAAALVIREVPDAVFLLIGGTKAEIMRLNRSIKSLELVNNVKVFMRKSRDEIPGFLAIAHILVLPRLSGENAPLKLFDYMKSGKPIVATDIPAHRAMLSEQTAILVEPRAQALANGILSLLKNPVLAARVAQASLNAAQLNKSKTLPKIISEVHSTIVSGQSISNLKRKFNSCRSKRKP
jgi:glycosyltransferase involved in cell wall biosynthesis